MWKFIQTTFQNIWHREAKQQAALNSRIAKCLNNALTDYVKKKNTKQCCSTIYSVNYQMSVIVCGLKGKFTYYAPRRTTEKCKKELSNAN